MGRITGALCSTLLVTLTTYLTTLHFRRTHTVLSHALLESKEILDALHYPPQPIRPLRAYVARPSIVETMKDAWNDEVEKGVRWVQSWDGRRARESVEGVLEAVWRRVNEKGNGGK